MGVGGVERGGDFWNCLFFKHTIRTFSMKLLNRECLKIAL